jgi:hypothetical protein
MRKDKYSLKERKERKVRTNGPLCFIYFQLRNSAVAHGKLRFIESGIRLSAFLFLPVSLLLSACGDLCNAMKLNHDKDENTLSRKAFAIEKEEAELVNGIPVSGEDYLLLVR